MRKMYLDLSLRKNKNIAAAAVARELSCFIWGMMTDHISEDTELIHTCRDKSEVSLNNSDIRRQIKP